MEFARVLVVGIVILAVLFVLFGGGFEVGEKQGWKFKPTERENKTEKEIPTEKGFFIGSKKTQNFQHIPLSDKAVISYSIQTDKIVDKKNMSIENGLVSEKSFRKIFEISSSKLPDLKYGYMSFEMDESNYFGKLLVILNDEVIYKGLPEKEEIKINKSLFKGENKLEVVAEDSGWRFWAPTVYSLKNFTLDLKYTGKSTETYKFDVKDEKFETFKMGRVVFKPVEKEGTGNLVLKINGKEIYRSVPDMNRLNLVDFKEVKEGTNSLVILSEPDSAYTLEDLEVIIFWNERSRSSFEKVFDLSRPRSGDIDFKIEKVVGDPVSLNIKIVDSEGEETPLVLQGVLAKGKSFSIDFDKEDVSEGENKILFSVQGDGGFRVSNLDIDLR